MTEPENPEDRDIEAPEADAAEQHTEVVPDDSQDQLPRELPIDVDPADVSEQREVGFDEDEYR